MDVSEHVCMFVCVDGNDDVCMYACAVMIAMHVLMYNACMYVRMYVMLIMYVM